MNVRFGQLLKVPVFCIALSYLGAYLFDSLISEFGFLMASTGSTSSAQLFSFIFSAVLFAATLLIGNFIFQDMTRRETLFSGAILVIIYIVLETVNLYVPDFSSVSIGIYTAYANEWCNIVIQMLNFVTKDIVISGFHMIQKDEYTKQDIDTIKETAHALMETGAIYFSGHCTGTFAYGIMKEIMGGKLQSIHSGKRLV